MLTKGTLIHRGGANNSTNTRLVVTPQYCCGWMRQIENMVASVSKENALKLTENVSLIYSIHPPFIVQLHEHKIVFSCIAPVG